MSSVAGAEKTTKYLKYDSRSPS